MAQRERMPLPEVRSLRQRPLRHPLATSPISTTFGRYAVATGVGLTLVPDFVLSPLGIPAPTEIWIRMFGALAVPLHENFRVGERAITVAFFRASVRHVIDMVRNASRADRCTAATASATRRSRRSGCLRRR